MHFLFIPDSFKGTLSSETVCDVLEEVAKEYYSDAKITRIPVADGGEGSVDVFLSLGLGEKKYCNVRNSFMEEKRAYYLLNSKNNTAIIELAQACGLPEVYDRRDPKKTTTYGVGEFIKDAIENGAKKVIIALGGSSTNDGGVGIACALGAKFYNESGEVFLPTGGTLKSIQKIDVSEMEKGINGIEFSVMCDVDTVLTGTRGASAVYGPQKGATDSDVLLLDRGLSHLNELWKTLYNKDFSVISGGGAAGGAGAGISAFLGGVLESGIEIVLRLTDFEERLKTCDYVFTGEGRFDEQSFMGKVISGVSQKTRKYSKKLIVIAGLIQGVTKEQLSRAGIIKAYATNPLGLPFEQVKNTARDDLIKTAKMVFEDVKLGKI